MSHFMVSFFWLATLGALFAGCIDPSDGERDDIGCIRSKIPCSTYASDALLLGEEVSNDTSISVAVAGDVNGDGLKDLLVGAPHDNKKRGAVYLIYGKRGRLSGNLSLASAGAKFVGVAGGDYLGQDISPAGDVDGDGYADFLVGVSPFRDAGGLVYLFYGKAQLFAGEVSVATADAWFVGENAQKKFYRSFSKAGDVNADGLGDLLIGGPATYLIYGRRERFKGEVNLSTAAAFFMGDAGEQGSPDVTVATVGDVNGDRFSDFAIGAHEASVVYLFYEKKVPYAGKIALSSADFTLLGEAKFKEIGGPPVKYGDLNGDGLSDFLIRPTSSEVYLFYGRGKKFSGSVSVTTADAKFYWNKTGSIVSLSSGGDINKDRYDDLVIATDPNYHLDVYLFNGGPKEYSGPIFLADRGTKFTGLNHYALSPSLLSDLDGDGIDDFIIGLPLYGVDGSKTGAVSLVYGEHFVPR